MKIKFYDNLDYQPNKCKDLQYMVDKDLEGFKKKYLW
jgi:hypothetical protein